MQQDRLSSYVELLLSSSSSLTSQATRDDEIAHCFSCNDHDTLLMVTQGGIAYGIRAYQVPIVGRTAKGQPIPSVLPAISPNDVITTILPVSKFADNEYLLLATEHGWIKKTPLAAFEKLPSRGLIASKLEEGDRLNWCQQVRNGDDILVGTSKGLATRFEAAKLRPTARTSRGVRAMKLKDGDTIADVNVITGRSDRTDDDDDNANSVNDDDNANSVSSSGSKEYALLITSKAFGKRVATSEFRTTARGGVGVIAIKFKPTAGPEDKVNCLLTVSDQDEILVITAKGIMLRQKVANLPSQSRSATGVTIQKLDKGDRISSVSIVPAYDETD